MPHKVKEEHPLPAVLLHWAHLVSMIVLGFTGFFIHYPFAALPMGWMRQSHFIFMYVLVAVLVIRVYYVFFGAGTSNVAGSRVKMRDTKNFWFQPENKGRLVEVAKYYLFFRKTHPATGKYNPLQKVTYGFWAILILMQAVTGFAMYWPAWGWFASLNIWVGGLMMMRTLHWFIMWLFLITVALHSYLSLAEDVAAFPLMFWHAESEGE